MNLLLSNLRDYNQIVLQQFMLQIDQFNIIEQITIILELLKNTIEQRKIAVKIVTGKLTEEQLLMYSDAARFQQIFYQLISNAIRFTQNGFITISIETEPQKDTLLVSVADSGIGMVA